MKSLCVLNDQSLSITLPDSGCFLCTQARLGSLKPRDRFHSEVRLDLIRSDGIGESQKVTQPIAYVTQSTTEARARPNRTEQRTLQKK
jgi:hypothetical protein